ncbi:unnamed protein product [Aphanomyces euteiches]
MDSALRREILDYGEICEVKRLASNEYRTVNLSLRTCSCQFWQDRLYPCVHGYAVILARRLQVSDFVDHVYTTAACISATSVRLTPIDIENCSSDSSTLPPLVRSTVSLGKKRIPSRGEDIVGGKPNQKERKVTECKTCGMPGHNKTTCAEKFVMAITEDMDVAQWQFSEGMWLSSNMFGINI